MPTITRALILSLFMTSTHSYAQASSEVTSTPGELEAQEKPHPIQALRIIKVKNFTELQRAVNRARPGDKILMRAGTYRGKLKIKRSGTKKNPIQLIGSKGVILKGEDTDSGYGIHLKANRWILKSFTVTNSKKGIVLDKASFNILSHLRISKIGEEGVHFRSHSTHNLLTSSSISEVGLEEPGYGEGVYVGSFKKHWCKHSRCKPDKSDYNQIIGNHIYRTRAEAIDIKGGASHTLVENNTLDGSHVSGENSADSLMDIKGDNTIVRNNKNINTGSARITDAYQVRRRTDDWGHGTVFENNSFDLRVSGYAIRVYKKVRNTQVRCNNYSKRRGIKLSNIACK